MLVLKTNKEIPVGKLIESMKQFSCINEFSNIYLFFETNDIIHKLENSFNIDLSKKRLTKEKIKKILKY